MILMKQILYIQLRSIRCVTVIVVDLAFLNEAVYITYNVIILGKGIISTILLPAMDKAGQTGLFDFGITIGLGEENVNSNQL